MARPSRVPCARPARARIARCVDNVLWGQPMASAIFPAETPAGCCRINSLTMARRVGCPRAASAASAWADESVSPVAVGPTWPTTARLDLAMRLSSPNLRRASRGRALDEAGIVSRCRQDINYSRFIDISKSRLFRTCSEMCCHPFAARSGSGEAAHPAAARISRSAAARASNVISAPASMRAISSRRRSGSSSAILVAIRLPFARASLVMR